MNKVYKLQYNTQVQSGSKGRTEIHKKIQTVLPAAALADMGLTKEDNLINCYYDVENKRIIIIINCYGAALQVELITFFVFKFLRQCV